eukprot:UN30744
MFPMLAGGYFGYSQYSNYSSKFKPKVVQLLPMDRPEDFVHPYADEPWYKQMLFRTARFLYLGILFTPVTLVGILLLLTDSESVRALWLNMLVNSIETAGCTFQKFAQQLSMRPDMFAPDVIQALGKLRCEVKSHSYEHTRIEIKKSFGKEIEELFEEFNEKPVASGTIAQVHKARLKPEYAMEGGAQDVAVKVRHPNVVWETYSDLDLVFKFVKCSVNIIHMSLPFKQDEFRTMMQQQIDFNWEAFNLVKFSSFFEGDEFVKFPKVDLQHLSPSVLVESWMPGMPLTDCLESFGDKFKEEALKTKKNIETTLIEKKKRLAEIVHDFTMKSFLRDNFVHGDLHGGNILLAEDGSLTVLDTGIITSIVNKKEKFNDFLKGLVVGNGEDVADVLLDFHCGSLTDINVDGFREKMCATVGKYVSQDRGCAPGGEPVDLGDLLGETMFNIQSYGLQLRGDIASSIQSM